MRLRQVTLVLVGGALVLVGLNGVFAPAALLAPLGIALPGASALSEARANYGGMHLGVGAFLVTGAVRRDLRTPALTVAALFLGGLVAGRVASLVVDGPPSAFVAGLLATELAGSALALVGLGRGE